LFQRVDLSIGSQINIDFSEECEPDMNAKVAHFDNVKNYMNLFPSFALIRETCYISHGNVLSQYNIIENQWMLHTIYPDNIRSVLRQKRLDAEGFMCCITTYKGYVYNDIFTPSRKQKQVEDLHDVSLCEPDLMIPYAVLSQFPDQEDSKKTFMLVMKLGFKFGIVILQGDYLVEVEGTETVLKDANIVIVFSNANETQFIFK